MGNDESHDGSSSPVTRIGRYCLLLPATTLFHDLRLPLPSHWELITSICHSHHQNVLVWQRLFRPQVTGFVCYLSALMVREMMHRVEDGHQLPNPPKISEYFDMICGSGLGGTLAIMCGVFRMTGDHLVEEFVGLCKVLFSHDLDVEDRTMRLEREIKILVATYTSGGEEKIISQDNPCKTFVCAASSHNTGHPRLFRTYRSRSTPSPDCTIREAIRATTVLPGLFTPIVIWDKHLSETFVGGELRWNNPTDELAREAAREFQGRHVACIISIGSGHPGHLSLAKGPEDLFPRIALDCERLADDMERRFRNAPDVLWRLSVEQGLQNLAMNLSDPEAMVSHTSPYIQGARAHRDIDSLLSDLVRRPRRILAKMISGEVSSATEVVGPRACPPPTQYFTGRRRPLAQLEYHFHLSSDECRTAVLHGMGGSGKTQTGLEFIRQNKSRFSDVYFIDASSKLTLENDLAAIAVVSSDQPSVYDALRILRSREDDWLLFFDNADDPSLNLRPYLSWSHGNVLITTRNPELSSHAPNCSIWVDRLDLDDAKELLLRGLSARRGSEEQAIAVRIVQASICRHYITYSALTFISQELGYLALAITQARAFIAKGLYAWEVYAKQHRDAVPPVLINLLSSFTAIDLTWNILRFRTLVGELLSFSLLEFDRVQHTFSLHPLVQEWARGHSQRYQDNARASQTLLSLATPIGDSILDDMRMRSLVPHLRESIVPGITSHYTLLSRMQRVFQRGSLLRQCHDVCQKQLTERRRRLGASHPSTLGSMGNLALTYSALGQHRNTLELNELVLRLQKWTRGEEHPDAIGSMNNLASFYSALGQHRKALELKEHVLKLRKRILGEEHPDTLTSMNNLANTYSHLGRHRNALDLYERTLEIRRRILGEDHPDTRYSLQGMEYSRGQVLRDESHGPWERSRLDSYTHATSSLPVIQRHSGLILGQVATTGDWTKSPKPESLEDGGSALVEVALRGKEQRRSSGESVNVHTRQNGIRSWSKLKFGRVAGGVKNNELESSSGSSSGENSWVKAANSSTVGNRATIESLHQWDISMLNVENGGLTFEGLGRSGQHSSVFYFSGVYMGEGCFVEGPTYRVRHPRDRELSGWS
ncbi:hypothetical protein DL96DRAFT_1565267 [Flagelloscypha sp. PMI_526]|nr:hypothetical protein DL96DRAFT_1565267 [Flagelloscypha sp. PMI_526]